MMHTATITMKTVFNEIFEQVARGGGSVGRWGVRGGRLRGGLVKMWVQ